MKRFLLPIAAMAAVVTAHAQDVESDSLKMYELQEVEVTATRATRSMPAVYDDLSKEALSKHNYGMDIPSVLALTPSMIATSETGIGVGNTSMRMRGTDATRLNVTINGVSMNNADSHQMYWYDTPDLISSVGTIQVQRGAGISTNGTGAFGGAINMTTDALQTEFGGDASFSYGSYNTNKQSVHVSSGLMGGHWTVDARISHIASDGYVDRGATDLKSYMLQAGYYSGNTMLKFVSFGGKARTYLTYQGATKEEMAKYGRRYHTSGQYDIFSRDGNGNIVTDPNNWDEPVVAATAYYKDQTDNYLQINNQMILNHHINSKWSMNGTIFYTYGYGFYRQYKGNKKLLEYSFPDDIAYDDNGKVRADIIRKKVMQNHLAGVNGAMHYSHRGLDISFGGSYSYYTCPHWGTFGWVDGLTPEQYAHRRWYDNDATKHDGNLFARANWEVTHGLRLFADLQFRAVSYEASGVNDNYVDALKAMQPIAVDKKYYFFNPHVGLSYNLAKRHNFYFSFSIAQKEPTRGDFTDRYMFEMLSEKSYPSSEKMFDYELGYNYTSPRFSAGINLYYMKYDNQLVPTGHINADFDALNDNVKDSYRRGIELSASVRATDWFTASANATFSQNRVENYVHRILVSENWEPVEYIDTKMGTTRLAFSPKTIANVGLDFHHKGFEAVFNTQYVSRQYFSNYENRELMLDPYCVTNLNLGYTLKTRMARSVRFGVMIYNLFDAEYESNGYGYSSASKNNGKVEVEHTAYYFAQAPINVMANVTVKF